MGYHFIFSQCIRMPSCPSLLDKLHHIIWRMSFSKYSNYHLLRTWNYKHVNRYCNFLVANKIDMDDTNIQETEIWISRYPWRWFLVSRRLCNQFFTWIMYWQHPLVPLLQDLSDLSLSLGLERLLLIIQLVCLIKDDLCLRIGYTNSGDHIGEAYYLAIFTILELNIGLICASITGTFVKYYWPPQNTFYLHFFTYSFKTTFRQNSSCYHEEHTTIQRSKRNKEWNQ